MSRCLLGIFVGGQGRRMGGVDKSALLAPETTGTLLDRALALGDALGMACVVVGSPPQPLPSGVRRGVVQLRDRPAGIGPLGGMCALLSHAGSVLAIALACDMPYVDIRLLDELRRAPPADVVAPRDPATGKWSPLCARYDSARALPILERAIASGTRSFQSWFAMLNPVELPLSPERRALLRDWDRPEDISQRP